MKTRSQVYREASVFYFTHPFSDVSPFSKISKSTGLNQQIGKQCFLPPLSFKISLRDTSFHISLYSLGFYFSPECLLNFLWLVCYTFCGKNFSIYGVHIPRKCIGSMHFYSCPSRPLKTPGTIFGKSASPAKAEVVEKAMICSI